MGIRKLPIGELILICSVHINSYFLCCLFNILWVLEASMIPTDWSDLAMTPCQPLTLFLSSLKIWNLSQLFGAVIPSLPLRALPPPFTSPVLILALKWINTRTKDCQNVCISCILQASAHAFLGGAQSLYVWVEKGEQNVKGQMWYAKLLI